MASVGPILCTSGIDFGGGDATWTNPGNITAADSTNATCVLLLAQTSDVLQALFTGSDFAAIPDAADLVGYAVDMRRRNLAGTMEDVLVAFDAGGGVAVADGVYNAFWSNAYNTDRYGGATDKWQQGGLSGAQFKAYTPQVQMQCTADTAGTAGIDWIKLTVFYTVAGSSVVQSVGKMAGGMQDLRGGVNG